MNIATQELIVFFDGAAQGNPGPAGAGVVFLRKDGTVLKEISYFLGKRTNNQAEYEALLIALAQAQDFSPARIILHTDSELLFRQIQGEYKVRNAELKKYHQQALKLLLALPDAQLKFSPRGLNRAADHLAKQAIKRHLKQK